MINYIIWFPILVILICFVLSSKYEKRSHHYYQRINNLNSYRDNIINSQKLLNQSIFNINDKVDEIVGNSDQNYSTYTSNYPKVNQTNINNHNSLKSNIKLRDNINNISGLKSFNKTTPIIINNNIIEPKLNYVKETFPYFFNTNSKKTGWLDNNMDISDNNLEFRVLVNDKLKVNQTTPYLEIVNSDS